MATQPRRGRRLGALLERSDPATAQPRLPCELHPRETVFPTNRGARWRSEPWSPCRRSRAAYGLPYRRSGEGGFRDKKPINTGTRPADERQERPESGHCPCRLESPRPGGGDLGAHHGKESRQAAAKFEHRLEAQPAVHQLLALVHPQGEPLAEERAAFEARVRSIRERMVEVQAEIDQSRIAIGEGHEALRARAHDPGVEAEVRARVAEIDARSADSLVAFESSLVALRERAEVQTDEEVARWSTAASGRDRRCVAGHRRARGCGRRAASRPDGGGPRRRGSGGGAPGRGGADSGGGAASARVSAWTTRVCSRRRCVGASPRSMREVRRRSRLRVVVGGVARTGGAAHRRRDRAVGRPRRTVGSTMRCGPSTARGCGRRARRGPDGGGPRRGRWGGGGPGRGGADGGRGARARTSVR